MEAGFRAHQVAFVTAYADRVDGACKGSVSELAWQSFAWFVPEPDHITSWCCIEAPMPTGRFSQS